MQLLSTVFNILMTHSLDSRLSSEPIECRFQSCLVLFRIVQNCSVLFSIVQYCAVLFRLDPVLSCPISSLPHINFHNRLWIICTQMLAFYTLCNCTTWLYTDFCSTALWGGGGCALLRHGRDCGRARLVCVISSPGRVCVSSQVQTSQAGGGRMLNQIYTIAIWCG